MLRGFDGHDDDGSGEGRGGRSDHQERLHNIIRSRESTRGEGGRSDGSRADRDHRFEHRPSHAGHNDGSHRGAGDAAAHNWQRSWQDAGALPPVYEAPLDASPWWESIKVLVVLGLTIFGSLYGVYALNGYLEGQHKETPLYGDTAAPPPGRGSGPPNISWGSAKH